MITVTLQPYVHSVEVEKLRQQLAPYRAIANAPVPTDPAAQKADTELRLANIAKAVAFVNWHRDTGRNAEETIEVVLSYKPATLALLEEALKQDDEASQNLFKEAAHFVEERSSARMISNLLALTPFMPGSPPVSRMEQLLRGLSPLKRDYGHPADYAHADEKTKREAAALMDAAYAHKFVRAKNGLNFISGGVPALKDEELIKLAVEFASEPGRLAELMREHKSVDAAVLGPILRGEAQG